MARCPFAIYRGPIPNCTPGGMVHPVRGLVLHVEEGTEQGTDSWFHNPQAQASSHFGIARDGTIHQWVDTDDRSWAEAAGNPYWWSVETEGTNTDPMTPQQVASLARLYGWLMTLPDNIPAQLAETVNGHGLGWHGMGGTAWGSHANCPGDARRAQRADALALIAPGPAPTPPSEEDEMFQFSNAGRIILCAGGRLVHVQSGPDGSALGKAAPYVGDLTDEQTAALVAAFGEIVG